MRRRRFLTAVALGTSAIAGCTGGGSGGTTTTTGPGPSRTSTTTAPPVSLADTSFTLRDQSCGLQRNGADVTFDPEAAAVRIEGTIWGSDTCVIAELAAATYDADADRLTVEVRTTRRDTTETVACGECIVEIDYEAVCTFDGGLPATVEVVHGEGERREVVTTAERDGA